VDIRSSRIARLAHFLHEHFLWALLASYAVASVYPTFGLWIRNISLGKIILFHEETAVTLPMMMLALLLLNAGLGVNTSQLRDLFRNPLPLIVGLIANLVIPIGFIFLVAQGMRYWHNPDELQNILVGLALIASMPIAGSSTAWAQNANGNLALSLGLVLLSTLLSPLTTPTSLRAVGLMTTGEYSQSLRDLAGYGTGLFLVICVLAPSLIGILLSLAIGPSRIAPLKPGLKLFNSVNLLLLSYSNASVSLPQTISNPDWDFLAVTLAIVISLCLLAFTSGWLIARLMKMDLSQQAALMFGLGMNNNGTGLVLASMTLSAHPRVMLPIIFYNLAQHLVAGGVDYVIFRKAAPEEARPTHDAQSGSGLPLRG
jgi:BASS family bile acid:Na+ symporter